MKKIIVSLSILLVLVLFALVVSANASSDCTEAVQTLESVCDIKLSKSYDSNVSKESALKFVVDLFGSKNVEGAQEVSVFSDITKGTDTYSIVSEAYWLGIVKPDDGLNFSSSALITTDEFCKMLIRAIGYEFKMSKYNYSLAGYTRLAKELDMLESADISDDGLITYAQMYNTVYNALFVDSVITYDADGKRESYVNQGTSVLEMVFGLKSFEGEYFGNEYCAFFGDYAFRTNEFGVTDKSGLYKYFYCDFDTHGYLGYNVKVYYEDTKSYNRVVAVVKSGNSEFVIDGDDFSQYDNSTKTFSYKTTQRIDSTTSKQIDKTLKITNSNINIIYNGQFVADSAKVFDIINNCGTENGYSVDKIVFVDNDRDSRYETIIIEVYRDLFVNYVNKETKTVADNYGDSFKFDFDSDNKYVLISNDGKETTYEKIAEGNVIRIKEGLGLPKLITVIVTANTVVARIESETTEDGRTTAVIVFAEPTAKGDQFLGSLVGGLDGDLPKGRYKIANSLQRHVDDILMTPYTFYKLSLNQDNEIAGYRMHLFDAYSGYNLHKIPYGINAYDSTGYGLILAASKSSSLKQDIKIKIFDMPMEIRFFSLHDYDLSDDVRVKNIKECWLWIDNPEEYFVSDDDGSVILEKVDLFNKLKAEYEKYGDDIKKYSPDVINFMMSYKFVTYRFNTDMQICEITLPGFGVRNGEISYKTVPGQTYYKGGSGFYSLYDGSATILPSLSISVMVPDPDCSYADRYDLCQSIYESGAISLDTTYKMDFYTFDQTTAEAQVSVRFMDYDSINNTGGASETGVVTKRTKGATPNGYLADNYYMFHGSNLDWGARRFYSVYPVTYKIPNGSNGKLSDKKYKYVNSATGIGGLLNYSFKIDQIDEGDKFVDIAPGDIATFMYPTNKTTARPAEPFSSAKLVYDRSEDKLIDNLSTSLTNLGDKKYVKGIVYDVTEDAVAFLPSFFYENAGDYEYGLKDCTIIVPNKVEIVLCEKLPDGSYSARKGEYVDLYESKQNAYTIVAYLFTRSVSPSADNTKFWIYVE